MPAMSKPGSEGSDFGIRDTCTSCASLSSVWSDSFSPRSSEMTQVTRFTAPSTSAPEITSGMSPDPIWINAATSPSAISVYEITMSLSLSGGTFS